MRRIRVNDRFSNDQRGGGAERSEAEGDVARNSRPPPALRATSPTLGEEQRTRI